MVQDTPISPMMSAPSPMLDAADASFTFSESTVSMMDIDGLGGDHSFENGSTASMAISGAAMTTTASAPSVPTPAKMIKVGQTSLHNPGGRSSWIGL